MEDATIINMGFVIFTIFLSFFLSIIFFIDKEKILRKIIQIIMIVITEMVGIEIKRDPSNFKSQGLITFKLCLDIIRSNKRCYYYQYSFYNFYDIFMLFYLVFFLQIKKKPIGKIIQIIMIVITGRVGVGIKRPF